METDRSNLRKFVTPEFVFGFGAFNLVSSYVKNYGGGKVLVVSDKGVMDAGWTGKVIDILDDAGIPFSIFSDLTPNPKSGEVMNGASWYAKEGCDLVVAVGGGSVVDCAKGISIVSSNGGHVLDFEGVDRISRPGAPLICIPTTAGSSADISQFAIITDEERKAKIAIVSKALVPDVSLIDPATTSTVGKDLTAAMGLDVLVHAFEAYVSNANSPLTDLCALEAARLVKLHLPVVIQKPLNTKSRNKMMLASLYAGLAFSNASLGLVHAMAHALGGFLDIVHGESNAILLPLVVEYNFEAAKDRYLELGKAMGFQIDSQIRDTVQKDIFLSDLYRFGSECGFIEKLGQLGVEKGQLHMLAINASNDACFVTNPRTASVQDIEAIYERAL